MGTMSTKIQNHEQRAHALLSASGASRWLACTPSARLEEQFGDKKESSYAKEGTLAHELSELYLTRDALEAISDDEYDARLTEIMDNELFNEEMFDMVPIYTDYCIDQFNAAKAQNQYAELIVEQKLDLTDYVPESFGTSDCTIISDDVMEVIDLKYGKGVPVYATWNKQLMLYGLGALKAFDTMYDINTVKLTIVQPRINNISTFEISVKELTDWAETELKKKAALAFDGKGELEAGDWCKFCSVKARCRKLYTKQLEIAKFEFKQPDLLSDEEVAEVLERAPQLVEWANCVAEYAKQKAIEEDYSWPGYKLVESTSRRKWKDENEVIDTIFTHMPELSEDDIYDMKLKSITAIEKLVGKKVFEQKLSSAVIKPQGAPILVPESDKRPAIGIGQAKLDFAD
jgi:hypothetical protein